MSLFKKGLFGGEGPKKHSAAASGSEGRSAEEAVFGKKPESVVQAISAAEVVPKFNDALARAFPNAMEEKKEGKMRTVLFVIVNCELLLDPLDVEKFFSGKGYESERIANSIKFYRSLNELGPLPKSARIPVEDARDAANWFEPYTYPSHLKGWYKRDGTSSYDEATGNPLSYESITNVPDALGGKEFLG